MSAKSKTSLKLTGLLALGVLVASPALVASAATDDTTITATVDSTISVTAAPNISVQLTPGGSAVLSVTSDTVSVSTNSNGGYTLSLANDDSTTELTGDPSGSIAAHTGTTGAPTPLTVSSWGFAVAAFDGFDSSYTTGDNQAGNSASWAGVPAAGSGVLIKDYSTGAVSNDPTVVYYGVRIDSSQPEGEYTDTVVYTATAQ